MSLEQPASGPVSGSVRDGFCLGPFYVQPTLNRISNGCRDIHLEPKVMAVLVELAERPFEVRSKDQLIDAVWPDTSVAEIALPRCISRLRTVLRDDARNPRYIETIPKAGYRLIAEVEPRTLPGGCAAPTPEPEPPPPSPSSAVSRRSGLLLPLALVLLLAVALGGRSLLRRAPATAPAEIDSIAVLPLRSLSPQPEEDAFTDALTDLLITDLARIGSLKVIAIDSMMRYKDSPAPLPQIAAELRVDAVLRGTVVRAGDRVRITAQLVDADTEEHLWAESYERELNDLLALQSDITRSIARGIEISLTPVELARLETVASADLGSLELYLQGRERWRRRGESELEEAATLFERSLELDPKNALAWAGLSDTHLVLATGESPLDLDLMARARREARRALELDPDLAEAHTSLAMIHYLADRDWAGAARHFELAIELYPGYPTAHQWYALFLSSQGRRAEAVREIERAVELDPRSAIVRYHAGQTYYLAERFDAALHELERAVALGHGELGETSHSLAALIHLLRDEPQAALLRLDPYPESPLGRVVAARYRLGLDAARQVASEIEAEHAGWKTSLKATYIDLFLGDLEAAVVRLEAAYEAREIELPQMLVDPFLAPLRGHPRFRALVERLRLPAPA